MAKKDDRFAEREIKFAKRMGPQLVKQAIRGNLVRSLVEPITNCDDSYSRMEEKGVKVDGEIRIHLVRGRRKRPVVGIRDNAEGMDDKTMEEAIGSYGEDTSGLSSGMDVRGVFGRGLKDAVLAVGGGKVHSIKGGKLYRCHLRRPFKFKLDPPRGVKEEDRKELGVRKTGTLVYIVVTDKKVAVPRFENLAYNLERNVLLRDIMRNPKRKIILEERDARGRVKKKKELSYSNPVGKELLRKKSVRIDGYPKATFDIVVKRSDEPLSQEGVTRDGGLLIKSGRAIHEATLLAFDRNEYAAHLFGEAKCDYINELIGKDEPEPVISDKRDGLNWDYDFCKAYRSAIERILEPIVKKERERMEKKEKAYGSVETKKRIRNAVEQLNKIAETELGKIGADGTLGGGGESPPPVPTNGLQFIPDFYQVVAGKTQTLSLKILCPSLVPDGAVVDFKSNNPEVVILDPSQLILSADDGTDGICTLNVKVEGKRVGAKAGVKASVNGLTDVADVYVVSDLGKTKRKKKRKKGQRGIFSDISHSPDQDPRKRVRYFDGKIIISTKSPSVAKYFKGGRGIDDSEFRVLESELVTEAVCRELANLKDVRGEVVYLTESGRIAAIQKEEEDLKHKYARMIHDFLRGENA